MIFIDTTLWVGAADKNDDFHKDSKPLIINLLKGMYGYALTSDFIINETVNILRKRKDIAASQIKSYVEGILNCTHLEVIFSSRDLMDESLRIFEEHKNGLSLTDSTSVLLMRKYGIKEIYSHDEEFDDVKGITRKTY